MSRFFAIGDLHISKTNDKPMDVFGEVWTDHVERICSFWREAVRDEDIVLIPGDISWAMRLENAVKDLEDIIALPGKKVFTRGNHDYWWASISKIRQAFSDYPEIHFIQNDCVTLGGFAIAGSRGWTCPQSAGFSKDDEKLYNRELKRLELSLQRAGETGLPIIAMLHFPPMAENHAPSGFTELFERFGVKKAIYGHLHGRNSFRQAFEGEMNGVEYRLCSCDYIGFTPILISE